MAVGSKVVLVVTKTHWQCLSCKLFSKRIVSIDQHLKTSHGQLSVTAKQLYATDAYCLSDSELDTTSTSQQKQSFHSSEVHFSEIRKEQMPHTVPHPDNSCQSVTEQLSKFVPKNQKQKDSKKPAHSNVKKKKVHTVSMKQAENFSQDSDEEYVPDDSEILESENSEDKDTTKPRASRRSKLISGKEKPIPALSKPHVSKGRKKITRKPTGIEKSVLLTDPLKDCVTFCTEKPKKNITEQTLHAENEEMCEESMSVVAEEFPEPFTSRTNVSQSSKVTNDAKVKHLKKSHRHDAVNKSSKHVDKSKIATCCVPWLLDSGRRAGDKVTKKSRRNLLSEEKQAVRELYGIFLPAQAPNAFDVGVSEGAKQQTAGEIPSTNIGQLTSQQSNLMPSVQRITQEDASSSHQNYLTNMFSPGTRDFFVEGSRTHDSLYHGYSSIYPQQQQQNPNYAAQASAFYQNVHNFPPQRSNVLNFQPYNQTTPPVLSTTIVDDTTRHQAGVGSYLGQEFNTSSLAHPHAMSASGNSVSHLVPSGPPSSADVNYDLNTNLVTSADCSASATNSLTVSSVSVKSDPTALTQSHASVSVPPNHQKRTILDSASESQREAYEQAFQSNTEFEKPQTEIDRFVSVLCKRCKCVFHGWHELNLHVFSVHETEKQAFCFICDQDVVGLEDLEKHVHKHAYNSDRHLADMRFHDCRFCGEELPSSYTTIRSHYYQHHVAYVCNECHGAFEDIQVYIAHSKVHEGRPIVCSICGSKFESIEDFLQHSPCPEDIWAEDGKGDQCFKCGLWCPNRAVVEAHRKQHRSQEDVEAYRQGAKIGFPCVSCEKVFKNKHACRRHIKMVHEGVSCYKHYCEYCGKGFLTKGHMRDHIALHHLKIKRYKCDYCNKQFVCGPTLRRHVRKEHTKHKPYQCQHCGERFFEKTPLQRHLTQHTGLAPFMCEHCGKGFYTKHSFTNHGSTHSTVKEFVCTGCQKGFTRKYNLQAHIKICKML